MDAGEVEKFAVAELNNFGGIFSPEMLPSVSILSLPVSLILLVDGHWIVWSQNIFNIIYKLGFE